MREGGYYHYAIICYNSESKRDMHGLDGQLSRRTTEHACVATSVCLSKAFLSLYFLALRYVKAFPAGAVCPAHRMQLADEVSKKCLPHQHDLSAYLFLRH